MHERKSVHHFFLLDWKTAIASSFLCATLVHVMRSLSFRWCWWKDGKMGDGKNFHFFRQRRDSCDLSTKYESFKFIKKGNCRAFPTLNRKLTSSALFPTIQQIYPLPSIVVNLSSLKHKTVFCIYLLLGFQSNASAVQQRTKSVQQPSNGSYPMPNGL